MLDVDRCIGLEYVADTTCSETRNKIRRKLIQFFKSALKIKVKFTPRTNHKRPEGEYRYSFTLSLTSALDGGGWSTLRPGSFTPPERDPVPTV